MKVQRQAAILGVIRRQPIRSQEQLRSWLRKAGFDVTQATLSRDVRELGLVKGGAERSYRTPEPAAAGGLDATVSLRRAVKEHLVRADSVQHMVVLRTGPGQAPLLGVALDGADLPEIVGTVAGDDTIFIVARDDRHAQALTAQLEHFKGEG